MSTLAHAPTTSAAQSATSWLRRSGFWLLLLGAIVGSLALLLWAWTQPFALSATAQINRKNFASLAHFDAGLRWRTTLSWLGLWALYGLAAWLVSRRPQSRRLLAVIGLSALALAVPWLLAYPGTSLDIFDYNFRGHMLARLGISPLQTAPGTIIKDAEYPFLAWRSYVDAYGPAWEYVSGLLNGLVNDADLRATLVPALTAYRLLALSLHLAIGGLIFSQLRGWRHAHTALWLWLANPLLLHEAASGGHNDGWMLLLTLLAALLVQRGRGVAGLLVLALAAHFKITALVALPGLGLWFWREFGWRRTWRAVALALPLAVALSWALYAPLGGWATLPRWFDERGRFVYASLAHWWALTQAPDGKISRLLAARAGGGATLVFGAALLVVLLVGWRRRRPLVETQWLSWGLFLWIGTFWFQPWYVAWLLPWALLSRRWSLIVLSIGYALLASCQPLLDGWWREPLTTLGTNTVAWLVGAPAALALLGAMVIAAWHQRQRVARAA